jgi:hypothetical protein
VGGTGRRCALAGCGLPIDDVVGRPQRLYCTPAHRMAARQSRRAAAQRERQARLTGGPDRSGHLEPAGPRGDEAGWAVLAEAALAIRAAYAEQQWLAAAVPPAAADSSPDGSVEQALPEWARRADRVSDLNNGFWPGWSSRFASAPGRHRAPEPAGRRRSLAAIGAAGIVAGSYALTWLSTAASPGPAAPSVPVQAPPLPPSEQRWVARAQVTVTSIDEQLELLERTEQLWRQRRPTDPPPPALEIRRDVLNQRRTALATRIDSVRALHQARAQVAESEDRGQLDALEAEAAAAVRTPLPEDGERTAEIADEVLLDIGPAEPPPSSGEVAPTPPDVDPGPREIHPRLPSALPPGVDGPRTEPPAAGSRPAGKAERSAHRAGQRGPRRSDPGRTHSRQGDAHRAEHTAGSAERHRRTSPCDSQEGPTRRTKRGHEDRPAERTSEGKKQPETKRSRLSRSARDEQHEQQDGHQHRHREKRSTRTG